MKKIILFCLLCACALGAFAQDAAPKNVFELTAENMKEVLTDLFDGNSLAPAPAKDGRTKKWQAAFFLTSDNVTWNYINDLTKQLQKQLRKGTLQYAVVLYDRKAKNAPGYRKKEDGVYLFTIGNFKGHAPTDWREEAPRYNYFFRPDLSRHQGTIDEMLDRVVAGLNKQSNTYNYLKIHAHGSGTTMSHYAQGRAFTFDTIQKSLKRNNLHIHVLDVHSCMMGTALNAYSVLKNGRVDYLLFASNIGLSPRAHSNTPILKHFDKNPKKAAQAAVNSKFSDEYISTNKTNNLLLVSRESAGMLTDFVHWLQQDYASRPLPRNSIPAAHDESNDRFGNISVNQLLQAWLATVPCKFNAVVRTNRETPVTTNVEEDRKDCTLHLQGAGLRKKLNKTVITYRCWDSKKGQLFTSIDQLPADSECMDGMTINKKFLQTNQHQRPPQSAI